MPIKFENSSGFVSNGRPFSSPLSPQGENPVEEWEEELEVESEIPEVEESELPPSPSPPPEPEATRAAVAELFFDLRDYIPRTPEESEAGDFVRLSKQELADYGIQDAESYSTMYRLAPEYLKVSDKTGAKWFRQIERWYPKGYLTAGKDLDYTPEAVAALRDYSNCPPTQRKAYINALRELYQRWQEWYRNRHVALVHCPVDEGEYEELEDTGELNQLRSQLEKSERGIDIYLGKKESQLEKAIETRVRQMAIRLKLKTADILNEELGINDESESVTSHERESNRIGGGSYGGREHLQGQSVQRFDIHRATPEYRATDGDVESEDFHLQRPWQEFAEDSEDSSFIYGGNNEWDDDSTGDKEWGEGVYHHPENPITSN